MYVFINTNVKHALLFSKHKKQRDYRAKHSPGYFIVYANKSCSVTLFAGMLIQTDYYVSIYITASCRCNVRLFTGDKK